MGKIKEIIGNTENGQVYIILKNERKKRVLRKDNMGYYVIIDKKNKLINRFLDSEDIKRITKFLGR